MSVSRVKNSKQYFSIVDYSYNSGNITIVANNHLLYTGVPIYLTSDRQYSAYYANATVTSANTFTVPATEYLQNLTHFAVDGFLSGQVGGQSPQTLPRGTGTDTIIQSYVNGAGGATFTVEVSLDKSHWISVGTIINANSSGNTAYLTIKPGWAYMRPNIGIVGSNTNLVIITGE